MSNVRPVEVENSLNYISRCRLLAHSEIQSSVQPIPIDVNKQDILLEILYILRNTATISPFTSRRVQDEIFIYTTRLFNKFCTPAQYPQIYAKIVLLHILTSCQSDNKNHLKLINKSFEYFNIVN